MLGSVAHCSLDSPARRCEQFFDNAIRKAAMRPLVVFAVVFVLAVLCGFAGILHAQDAGGATAPEQNKQPSAQEGSVPTLLVDSELKKAAAGYRDEMQSLEAGFAKTKEEFTAFLDDLAKRDLDNLSDQERSEIRVELGKFAEKGVASVQALLDRKGKLMDLLGKIQRNADKSEVESEVDIRTAEERLKQIEGDTRIKDEKQFLITAQQATLESFKVNLALIRSWEKRGVELEARVTAVFVSAEYCKGVLSDCKKILTCTTDIGAALAQLEAHVRQLQNFTIEMAKRTKEFANSLVRS